jgi:hypothetical protein
MLSSPVRLNAPQHDRYTSACGPPQARSPAEPKSSASQRPGIWQSAGQTGICLTIPFAESSTRVKVERSHRTIYRPGRNHAMTLHDTLRCAAIGSAFIQGSTPGLRRKPSNEFLDTQAVA